MPAFRPARSTISGRFSRTRRSSYLGLAQPVTSHERGDTYLVGQPIMMSRTPSHIAKPPPRAGEHSAEILSELGFSAC